jgi:hypothetical protein
MKSFEAAAIEKTTWLKLNKPNQLRQSCNDESFKATQNFLAQYEDKYRAEVLILREEMLRRLPELRQKAAPPVLASHPTNALGLGEVASTLEVL